MSFFPRRVLLVAAVIALPPAALAYRTITGLEAKYPRRCPDALTTDALRNTPNPATHHTPYADIDVYTARVPAAGLRLDSDASKSGTYSLEEAWARTFFQSPFLRAEGRLLAFSCSPGDCGEHGFHEGQRLLNVAFEVRRPPTSGKPLLVSWKMPDGAVAFFRRLGAYGYPWRLLSGGREEFAVGEVDAEGMVEVGFSSAHDYENVKEEGDAQKTVPRWSARLHRAYAMLLLDERAEAIRRRARDAGLKDLD
ncbi:hypothetical protein K466DRAFT_587614 [Polyporus arcularius HHB13444]|uniref:Uncharacterized protein n=1 Tax=Polyporus arcularius HHB13444 TaxID=1314778 RepID=A0A5C3P8K1_9APHY|nr:hypothetical protein K466DRAFT_587614 [Polyporus arcularius HHB13444]